MDELNNILINATAAIEEMYFQLPIQNGHAVFRERVYCYELYHQMRVRWPLGCQYTLNGELSKAGHPILSEFGAIQTPDMLVHMPGNMNGNHAIIEVKACTTNLRGIKKDVRTFSRFYNDARYERAIYILYGTINGVVHRIEKEIESCPFIELWIHEKPGASAYQLKEANKHG